MKVRRLIVLLFFELIATNLVAQTEEAIADIKKFQDDLNKEFSDPKTSPLSGKTLKRFTTLPFYAIDLNFRVNATLKLTPGTEFKPTKTTTTRFTNHRVFGMLEFTLDGKSLSVPVYQSRDLMQTEEYKDYLFFPFTDLTTGEESYGGGRYIDLRIPKEGDQILVDFNKAYNPSCAYSPKYSCPIVPDENRIDLAIRAGVRYEGGH